VHQKGELPPAAPSRFILISPSEWFYSSFTSFLHIIFLLFLICKYTMFMFIHLCHVSYISVFLLSLLYCISLILPVYIHFILLMKVVILPVYIHFIFLMKTEFFLLFLHTSASISFNFSNYTYLIFSFYISLLVFPSQKEIYPFPFLYISMCIPLNIIDFFLNSTSILLHFQICHSHFSFLIISVPCLIYVYDISLIFPFNLNIYISFLHTAVLIFHF
jgi:hypothetical protein